VSSHEKEEEQTKHLLLKLLDKYGGATLEQLFPQGLQNVIDGESCFHIQLKNEGLFTRPCSELCRDYIMSNLKLVRGIGPHYEMKLKKRDITHFQISLNIPVMAIALKRLCHSLMKIHANW